MLISCESQPTNLLFTARGLWLQTSRTDPVPGFPSA
jgi:hypothetical protein